MSNLLPNVKTDITDKGVVMRVYEVVLFRAGTKVTYRSRTFEVTSHVAKSNEIGGLEQTLTLIPIEQIDGEWEIADGPEHTIRFTDKVRDLEIM